ncbi:MAG: KEOPS complex kinase/ATPase Bud32 [Candidatus Micrarchaeia archaeon]
MVKKISEGAEAILYSSELLGRACVIKFRRRKIYRIREIDESIREKRTKTEARILSTANSIGVNVPKLLMVGRFAIYMTMLDGELLSDVLRKNANSKIEKILEDAGKALAKLHNANIVHGDYTPANIMVCKGKAYIIDFGLSLVESAAEEKALDLLLMKRSLKRRQYLIFEKAYSKLSDNFNIIKERLESIERRGRYQTRTLIAN